MNWKDIFLGISGNSDRLRSINSLTIFFFGNIRYSNQDQKITFRPEENCKQIIAEDMRIWAYMRKKHWHLKQGRCHCIYENGNLWTQIIDPRHSFIFKCPFILITIIPHMFFMQQWLHGLDYNYCMVLRASAITQFT